jgi:hypothetical protein
MATRSPAPALGRSRKKDNTRQHTVDIMGINALGPIHQGKPILSGLLQKGGRLRVLLLDPESQAWEARRDQEHDSRNRIGAELLAALYGLSEVKSEIPVSDKERLEVRVHAEKPKMSLIIVDRDFEDGVVMENWYPTGEHEHKRGIEGPSYFEAANSERGKEDLVHFDELWKHAVPIDLPSQRFNWLFLKQNSSNKK